MQREWSLQDDNTKADSGLRQFTDSRGTDRSSSAAARVLLGILPFSFALTNTLGVDNGDGNECSEPEYLKTKIQ